MRGGEEEGVKHPGHTRQLGSSDSLMELQEGL